MGVYKRYFRVASGALIDEIEKIKAQRDAASAALDELRPKVGAKDAWFWKDGTFACFTFEKDPDPAVYRRTKYGWVPKKNCKEGKAIWAEIKKVPACPHYERALLAVELNPDIPCLTDGSVAYWPALGGFPGKNIWFISVPWKDVDPDEMADYIAKNEAGTHYNRDLDHLRWTPPADWLEIKEWQYLKEWEELSEESK